MSEGEEKGMGVALDSPPGSPPSLFEDYNPVDIRDLIHEYPLAWVCTAGGSAEAASLLPLIGEYDEAGRLIQLVGHMSRQNPLHAALRAEPCSLILFNGPQAYVSPNDVGNRGWAPTWIYAQIRVEAEIRFEPPCTEEALSILVDAMEKERAQPWRAEELGGRYSEMVKRIIGFRGRVTKVLGRFKLGQDEEAALLETMTAATPEPAMRRWIRRFSPPQGDRNG